MAIIIMTITKVLNYRFKTATYLTFTFHLLIFSYPFTTIYLQIILFTNCFINNNITLLKQVFYPKIILI